MDQGCFIVKYTEQQKPNSQSSQIQNNQRELSLAIQTFLIYILYEMYILACEEATSPSVVKSKAFNPTET